MIITCEKCETRFGLDENLIKESGSKVRCSKCRHIFTAYKPVQQEEMPLAPSLEEEVSRPAKGFVEEPPSAAEARPGPEVSDETLEESLDLDLFASEGAGDEGAFSLEDLTLDDDFAPEEIQEPSKRLPAEEDISAEEQVTLGDLGFEEELHVEGVSKRTQEPTPKEQGEEEIALEDLSLDEEVSFEAPLPSSKEVGKEAVGGEEEISFEDLMLEQEPTEEPAEAVEEWTPGGEGEEEIALEDLSLEGDETEEAFPELELPEEEADEALEEAGVELSETAPEEYPEEAAEEAEEPPGPYEEKPRTRKRISTPLLVVLIMVLVGGAAYAGYTVLKSLNIKIPFLESLVGPQTPEIVDPGNLHTSLLEELITSEFVDNQSVGRLFVIKGQVRNDYPEARNFIRVKGVIYLKDGKEAQNSMVYCGNILSDVELQTADRLSIKKRLNNRFGDNKSNLKVSPGQALSFMIVFFDIPQELGEFSVEAVDSAKG
jgi:predicted Zn finger-like uncharacterized protein